MIQFLLKLFKAIEKYICTDDNNIPGHCDVFDLRSFLLAAFECKSITFREKERNDMQQNQWSS